MAKAKVEKALKDVRNTTTMVKKFVELIKVESSIEELDSYLKAFHDTYSQYPYYHDVKESILAKVEALGVDVDHINDMLS